MRSCQLRSWTLPAAESEPTHLSSPELHSANRPDFTRLRCNGLMTKQRVLVVLVIIALVVVALGAQMWTEDDDPGAHQTDRDTVMDQAPLEPPSPPQPPAGRTGDEP